ncbi:unnamed protein product [Durusdinium trenchii]|uniref:CFAP65-like ninth Ig-like domain-containing protein n=1 Tax=Durusdinium trenchii TaxID=1381693 RepID=A0ABP0J6A8_9DINO
MVLATTRQYRGVPEKRLKTAAAEGNLEGVRRAVAEGASSQNAFRDKSQKTALHEAAKAGSVEVLRCLLELGFDLNAADKYGITPLDEAEYWQVEMRLRGMEWQPWLQCRNLLGAHGAQRGMTNDVQSQRQKKERQLLVASPAEQPPWNLPFGEPPMMLPVGATDDDPPPLPSESRRQVTFGTVESALAQYPYVQIADLRTESESSSTIFFEQDTDSLSDGSATLQPQSMMWTQFQASHRTHISAHSSALHKALVLTPQVDGINDLYQGEVVDVERKFQNAIGIDEKKRLVRQLKPFQLLFGTSAVESSATVVYLALSNPGYLPIRFSFQTPENLNLENVPYWCDEKALVDEREAHFTWVEEHGVYDIQPRTGAIAPGDFLHVKLTYHHHSIGTHILPVVFNVHDGRSVLFYLKGHSVDGRPSEELCFDIQADGYMPGDSPPEVEAQFPANLPIQTYAPVPGYGAALSIEILDFKAVPLRARHSEMLVLVNYTSDFVLSFRWDARKLFRFDHELEIEPSVGELRSKGQNAPVVALSQVHISVANRLTVSRFRNLMSTAAGQKFLNENLHRTSVLSPEARSGLLEVAQLGAALQHWGCMARRFQSQDCSLTECPIDGGHANLDNGSPAPEEEDVVEPPGQPEDETGNSKLVGNVLEHLMREVIAEEEFGSILDRMLSQDVPFFLQYEGSDPPALPPPDHPAAPEPALRPRILEECIGWFE